MIDYINKDLFWGDSIQKELTLSFSGGDILHNEDVYYESMEITESLCSEQQLKFGTCEASAFKIRIANSFISHINEIVEVSMIINGDVENPFKLGTYKILSDKPTADKVYRDLTGYDAIYEILDKDVREWYDSILPDEDASVSVKAFRDSLIRFLDLEQENVELVNDNALIKRTINTDDTLLCKDVLNLVGEINGVFGHINRDNKFTWVTLNAMRDNLYPKEDLYPSDTLYPGSPMGVTEFNTAYYKSCTYEDYEVRQIEKLTIRESDSDEGTTYGEGTNGYTIQGNFLLYGKSADEILEIAKNIYSIIGDTVYLPAEIECKGNPCLEVGDGVLLHTKYKEVYTYILSRTLKGIQSLTDKITAKGEEFYSVNNNSTSRQVEQLASRTRALTQTVDSVKSELAQTAKNVDTLSSSVEQTAEKIETKVSKGDVSSQISQEADTVTIKGNRLVVESDNFKLDSSGNAEFSGTIEGANIKIQSSFQDEVYANDNTVFTLNEGNFVIGGYSEEWGSTELLVVDHDAKGHLYIGIPALSANCMNMLPYTADEYSVGDGNRMWGGVYAYDMYSTNYHNVSDKRVKENIKPLNDKLIDAVGNVPFKQFNFIGRNKKVNFGIIAQDVLKNIKDTSFNPDDYSILDTYKEDYLAVDYEQFLLVRVAYDEKKIKSLESTVAELTKRLERLEGKNE